jgi:HK97 family phage prohead protease
MSTHTQRSPIKRRAYTLLRVKRLSDGERIIEGVATTPTPDRMQDVVEPLGVTFKNPLPLLWAHNPEKPVGYVNFGKPTEDGIPFKAQIESIDEPGVVKDRLDEAWQSVKLGLVRGVSIGFMGKEISYLPEGGIHFLSCEVFELSLVTIPANAEATIMVVKSLDRAARRKAVSRKPVRKAEPRRSEPAPRPTAAPAAPASPGPLYPAPLFGLR